MTVRPASATPVRNLVEGAPEQPAPVAAPRPSDPARARIGSALNHGYQYLIGQSFDGGARALHGSRSRGLAIVDGAGATPERVRELTRSGVLPIAYNNAFQTQPGERLPPGVRALDHDRQWGETVPDYTHPAWQARRIGEAVTAARNGFGGVMLDNVPRAGTSRAAADFVARMAREARAASGNPSFGVILQNGEQLVRAHPWLVRDGYVAALQKEDVSFRVNGAGTGTGVPVSETERAQIGRTYAALRREHPDLPTIAVDYPSNAREAQTAQARARALGFNVSHVATRDGELARISRDTRVVTPVPTPANDDRVEPRPTTPATVTPAPTAPTPPAPTPAARPRPSEITYRLRAAVGPGERNRAEDVRWVKERLSKLRDRDGTAYLSGPSLEHARFDRATARALARFQRDHTPHRDGTMAPDRSTYRALAR